MRKLDLGGLLESYGAILQWRSHDLSLNHFDTIPACDRQADGRSNRRNSTLASYADALYKQDLAYRIDKRMDAVDAYVWSRPIKSIYRSIMPFSAIASRGIKQQDTCSNEHGDCPMPLW